MERFQMWRQARLVESLRTDEERGLYMSQQSNAKHEEVEKLAYQRWEERGGPFGSPDDDWYLAEQEITERSDPVSQLPSSTMEPLES
jgi:hypothetical protein